MSRIQGAAASSSTPQSAGPHHPVAIVGTGPVGLRCAQALIQRGCSHPVVLFGEEPWQPYDRVRLSSLLCGEIDLDELVRHSRLPLASVAHHDTRITQIDRATRTLIDARGQSWPWHRLVLATGSSPWVPDLEGLTHEGQRLPGVFTFRDLDDASELAARQVRSRHTVVLGGGLLGLEAARAMQRHRTRVTVVEAFDRPMARQLDDEGGRQLGRHIAEMGIELLLREAIVRIIGEDRVRGVLLRSGRMMPCDTLIIACGIRPRTELARQAGIAFGRGIHVDDQMRTDAEGVYAIGECIEHRGQTYGLVAPGLEQAEVAAHHICGEERVNYTGSKVATRLKVAGCAVFSAGEIGEEAHRVSGRPITWHEDGCYRRLIVSGSCLIGAAAVGEWNDISRIQEAIDKRRRLWPWQIGRFRRTGSPWPEGEAQDVAQWPDHLAVCQCMSVSRGVLGQAMQQGCRTVEALQGRTGAGTVCGSCKPLLGELLGAVAQRTALPWSPGLLGLGALALLGTLLVLLLPGLPFATSVSQNWDVIWRSALWKQLSGYTVLALSVLALVLSLRKRLPAFRLWDYDLWRVLHVALGALTLTLLWVHSGGRSGHNLDAWLMFSFSAMLLAGALLSLIQAKAHALPLRLATRLRQWTLLGHILCFWPVPLLLLFHVVKIYVY